MSLEPRGLNVATLGKTPRPGLSIRIHLAMLIVLVALPSLVICVILLLTFAKDRRLEAENRTIQLATDLAADISSELERSITILRTLSTASSIGEGDFADFNEQARRALESEKRAIILVSQTGELLADTSAQSSQPRGAYAPALALQAALATDRPYVTDIKHSATGGAPVIDILLPVSTRNGARYALVMSLPVDKIQRRLREQSVGSRDWITEVSDHTGTLIARSRDHEAFVGRPSGSHLRLAGRPDRLAHYTRSIDGRMIVQAVDRTRVAEWTVGASVTQDFITSFVWSAIWKLALVILLLIGLAALLVRSYAQFLEAAFANIASGQPNGFGARLVKEAGAAAEAMAVGFASLRFSQHSLAAAMDVAGLATWGWNERRRNWLWSPEARSILGADGSALMDTTSFEALIHPDDRKEHRRRWEEALNRTGVYAFEYRIRRPSDGKTRWIQSRARVERIKGKPDLMIGALRDVTDEVNAKLERSASEERLRIALETADAGVWSFDLVSGAPEWDGQSCALFGCDPDQSPPELAQWLAKILSPESRADVERLMRAEIAAQAITTELQVRAGGPGNRWLMSSVRIKPGKEGAPPRLLGLSIDITARRHHEQHIAMLMREVNHRAKNMLAVVASIARQTARTNKEDYIPALVERIRALSYLQDLLVNNEYAGVQMADLVEAQLKPFGKEPGRINASGPPLLLTSAAAQAIGLALHELATNAIKYGSLSVEQGSLEICWWSEGGRAGISWREIGGPQTKREPRRGFGTTVITSLVEFATNGVVSLRFPGSGCEWELTCSLQSLTGPADPAFSLTPDRSRPGSTPKNSL
jgi:PAS domain S-box-containing protein